ncbi:hypothetical protein [Candidatus Cyanaurora vandensis]|uniref:hypothetical protein n=1 Tax=Candidatus Cyanaurora vandensis TaxID=2714958 RepID=UPI00258042D8|nr:hypothetical protein [Candidatus Cyanaurora vandensis]
MIPTPARDVRVEELMAERTSCYQIARRINQQRVILCRALRIQSPPPNSFREVLLHDLNELTAQLSHVLSQSRRLTLQIIFQQDQTDSCNPS